MLQHPVSQNNSYSNMDPQRMIQEGQFLRTIINLFLQIIHLKPPDISVADPIFVNLNSYESLRIVLRKIGKDAGDTRYGGMKCTWTTVCCDGLPYKLCMKIIDQTFRCGSCSFSIMGIGNIKQHQANCNPCILPL